MASSGSRGPYSSAAWRKASAAFLAKHRICECEQQCGQPSAITDHIVPIKAGGMFWDRNNWQALSERCHRIKSRHEQGERGDLPPVKRDSLRIKGCDQSGMPLDPRHPWNLEK